MVTMLLFTAAVAFNAARGPNCIRRMQRQHEQHRPTATRHIAPVLEALPGEGNTTRTLAIDESVALDELGPVVIAEDGSMRHIDNWETMTPEEREATQRIISKRNAARLNKLRGGSSQQLLQRGTFSYGGFTCAYRRKPAASGFEDARPILLVHPVGIGLASWFWDRFLDAHTGAEVFVPDLIGCGESDAWQPEEQGLFIPLDWVRALETLWREQIQRPMVVVSQGGLAPLAVALASRETDAWRGSLAVSGLVLASPPEWDALADGYPDEEVASNFEKLGATIGNPSPLGTLGYNLLCARPFVQFFSDAFLFAGKADEAFLDACLATARPERRWPVIAFNAGLVASRGYATELRSLPQPTLVLSGASGGKPKRPSEFEGGMRRCSVRSLPGLNVLPWESTAAVARAVGEFARGLEEGGDEARV